MVVWMSTINSSISELLDHLRNNTISIEDNKSFEKKLNIIEEGLKEKIKLKDDLNVSSLIDIVKLLYFQCLEKDDTIRDLREENEQNNDKISSQKAQIENLTNVRHTFEIKISELESINEDSNLQIQELDNILQKKSGIIDNLKKEVAELTETNNNNEYEYNGKIRQLETQIERITNSESLLKAELEKRIDNVNYEKNNLRTMITKEQEKVMNLSKEIDDLKSENKSLNAKIRDYECKFLEVEDLAHLYEECAEDKKYLETELHSYRELIHDPTFQKSYFLTEKNNLLYGEGEDINDVSTDKSETLKEELEKVNKKIDEDSSEIKSIKSSTANTAVTTNENKDGSPITNRFSLLSRAIEDGSSVNENMKVVNSENGMETPVERDIKVKPIYTNSSTTITTTEGHSKPPMPSAIITTSASPLSPSIPIPTPSPIRSKITEDPDILSLIEERQKKYAASTASNSHLEMMNTMEKRENEKEKEKEKDKEKNLSRSFHQLYGDEENVNHEEGEEGEEEEEEEEEEDDEYNEANLSFVSVNSSIFDDNSSFFLENDAEYKQSVTNKNNHQQQFLQPPETLKPGFKVLSPKLGALISPLLKGKSSKLSSKSNGNGRSRSKSEPNRYVRHNSLGKPSNVIPKLNSITAYITTILEKIKDTELKTLNLQLRKSFDMVELTSLSNKILQNILSDIELFHKRYPLTTNSGTLTSNSDDDENSTPVHRSTSLKFKTTEPTLKVNNHNNKSSNLIIEVTNDQEKDNINSIDETNDKKKYTEESIAIHNLVLILQNILNELCLARMLTNDYGKLYFQELDKASQREAAKFLHDQKHQESINSKVKLSRSKSSSKSNNLKKTPTEPTTISREIPTQDNNLVRGGSLKENKFFKSITSMFRDSKDENKLKSKSNSFPSLPTTSQEQIDSTSSQPSSSTPESQKIATSSEKSEKNDIPSSSKDKEEKKSNNFMDFFKFKLNFTSHDEEKEKEKEKEKEENDNKNKYLLNNNNNNNNNNDNNNNNNDNNNNNNDNNNNHNNHLTVNQENGNDICTEASDILFTVTPVDAAVLSDEQQQNKIKNELLNDQSIIVNVNEPSSEEEFINGNNKKYSQHHQYNHHHSNENQESTSQHQHQLPSTNNDKGVATINADVPIVDHVADEDVAFSYNSSDISISSYSETLPIRTSTRKQVKNNLEINANQAILSSSPYYHADSLEKPLFFEKSDFIDENGGEDFIYTSIKKNNH